MYPALPNSIISSFWKDNSSSCPTQSKIARKKRFFIKLCRFFDGLVVNGVMIAVAAFKRGMQLKNRKVDYILRVL